MSTLSVPLTPKLEEGITSLLKSGYASSKADFARRAIEKAIEDAAVQEVRDAEREARAGILLRGDIREIAKKFA